MILRSRVICQRYLRLEGPGRMGLVPPSIGSRSPKLFSQRMQSTTAEKPYLPRIAQPSLWESFVPKAWREGSSSKPSRKSNPANFFIWIYLLIGSQAIRILTLKNERQQHNRLADIKLRQLREVIERLENGEDVDVEQMLGTGDPQAELEWEQALRELESEERLWQNNRSKRRNQKQMENQNEGEASQNTTNIVTDAAIPKLPASVTIASPPTAPGFY